MSASIAVSFGRAEIIVSTKVKAPWRRDEFSRPLEERERERIQSLAIRRKKAATKCMDLKGAGVPPI